MPRIERAPIQADIGAEAVRLDEPLRGVVAPLAQALECAKPEFVDVAMMRFDGIADFCRRDDTAFETERARAAGVFGFEPCNTTCPTSSSAVSAHRLNLSSAGSRKTTPDIRSSRLARNLAFTLPRTPGPKAAVISGDQRIRGQHEGVLWAAAIGDSPHRAISVFGNEESAVMRHRHADGAGPNRR